MFILHLAGIKVGTGMIKSAIFYPVTGSPYWFMKVYMFLYITSPLLNAGLRNLERIRLRNTLIILIVASFYGLHSYAVDSYLHGVYLYCVGYYLAKYNPYPLIKSGWWFAALIIIMLSSGSLDWALTEYGYANTYFQSYRNIFVFVGGIMLLLTFRELNLSSRTVNAIASCSLGCYLLQDGYFGRMLLYPYQKHVLDQHGYSPNLVTIYLIIFLLIWGCALILNPILSSICNKLSTYIEKLNSFMSLLFQLHTIRNNLDGNT